MFLILVLVRHILGLKLHFKASCHLQNRENLHFLLPPRILRPYTGYRFEQTMSECINILQRVKVQKILRTEMVFISKSLWSASCACVGNMLKT